MVDFAYVNGMGDDNGDPDHDIHDPDGHCGHWLHFLDGDDDNCWMVCDSCLSMTCTTDSQEKTLTEWSKKNA